MRMPGSAAVAVVVLAIGIGLCTFMFSLVYGIYFSLFAWFTLFPLNMWLQYRKVGPWRDYLFGERMYMLLSLTAKSLLAWQTFAGTLRSV